MLHNVMTSCCVIRSGLKAKDSGEFQVLFWGTDAGEAWMEDLNMHFIWSMRFNMFFYF